MANMATTIGPRIWRSNGTDNDRIVLVLTTTVPLIGWSRDPVTAAAARVLVVVLLFLCSSVVRRSPPPPPSSSACCCCPGNYWRLLLLLLLYSRVSIYSLEDHHFHPPDFLYFSRRKKIFCEQFAVLNFSSRTTSERKKIVWLAGKKSSGVARPPIVCKEVVLRTGSNRDKGWLAFGTWR